MRKQTSIWFEHLQQRYQTYALLLQNTMLTYEML